MRFRHTQRHSGNPLFFGVEQAPWFLRHPRWSVVLFVVLLVGIAYLIYGLPSWRITTLEVKGSYTLSLNEVRDITRAQLQGRWLLFFRQHSLWAFDAKAYERRLRERWIFTDLQINKVMPHTLRLEITEQQPAFLYLASNQIFGIDQRGVASTIVPAALANVPTLQFITQPQVQLTSTVLTETQATFLAAFLSELAKRNDEKLRVQSVTIADAPDTTVRLAMKGEWEIIANAAGSVNEQAEALLLAYDQKLKGKTLQYVDVSVPSRVYVK